MAKQRTERKKVAGVDMLAFSSIMTIMLAFFIMLTSFIEEQNAELLMRASASFRRAVSSFGLNPLIEKLVGKDIIQLDVEQYRENFPSKPVDNIYLEDENDNNLLEEVIEFEDVQQQSEAYILTLIRFDSGDYRLNANAKSKLDDFINLVADRPSKIIVEGKVGRDELDDDKGDMDWYLSSFRANTVAEYLNDKGRIDRGRISIIGYGKHRPLVEQTSSAGQNSFVGLIILND